MAPRTPKWTKPIRAYIIAELAIKVSVTDIYSEVTSPDFEEKEGIKFIDSTLESYGVFLRKCRGIPEDEIKEAYADYKSEVEQYRWSSEKNRIRGLEVILNRLIKISEAAALIADKSLTSESLKNLTMTISEIRAILEQIRKERSADADREALLKSGQNKLLIANPQNIEITPELLRELTMMSREDMGGLHTLDFTILDIKELESVKESINKAIEFKLSTIPEIENEELKDDKEEDN